MLRQQFRGGHHAARHFCQQHGDRGRIHLRPHADGAVDIIAEKVDSIIIQHPLHRQLRVALEKGDQQALAAMLLNAKNQRKEGKW